MLPGCGSSSVSEVPKNTRKTIPAIEVETITVEPQNWPKIVRCQGNLVADDIAVIGAKVAGRVAEVHVDMGDRAATGNPLVTIDHKDFQLKVDQAKAQLIQARSSLGLKDGQSVDDLQPNNSPPVRQERAMWDEAQAILERAQVLREKNAITESELEGIAAKERVAAARFDSALNSVFEKIALVRVRQAELASAQQQLEDAVIWAPFRGRIQAKHVAPGAYVDVGDPIVTLYKTDPLCFQGAIPERYALDLAVGQNVVLNIESVDQPYEVQVTRISPALDPRSRLLIFEAEVDNSERSLRTGLFAEARVVVDSDASALVIPDSAVKEFAGVQKVWKVVDQQAQEQEVLTGQRRSGGVRILEGVAEGDVLLLNASEGRVAKVKTRASLATRGVHKPRKTVTAHQASHPRSTAETIGSN